jgi:hypothetical protein
MIDEGLVGVAVVRVMSKADFNLSRAADLTTGRTLPSRLLYVRFSLQQPGKTKKARRKRLLTSDLFASAVAEAFRTAR